MGLLIGLVWKLVLFNFFYSISYVDFGEGVSFLFGN